MHKYGSTIGGILKWDGLKYDDVRVEMLRLLVRDKIRRIFDGTYVPDPINVFIKPEPHKASKIAEGRFRLIMAVSFEDAMIDRMLYSEFMRRAVTSDTPVKIGYAPLNGRYRELAYAFPGKCLAIDKKAWDFSVPGWMIDLWAQFLEDCVGGGPTWWVLLHRARFEALYGADTLFQFSDGSQARQLVRGIMKSGCFNTLLLNSVGQYIIARLASRRRGFSLKEFWTIGDDTVEEVPDDLEGYLEEIGNLGFSVKEAVVSNYVEFCGYWVEPSAVKPAYWRKHLFKALREGGESWKEKLLMYQFLYAFDEQLYGVFADMLAIVDGHPPVPAELWRLLWRGVV